MGEKFFTTNDVAIMLRVDKSTIKRWTEEGKLKCLRTPGGHRKFRSEDLYDFMSKNNYGDESIKTVPQMMSDELIIRNIVQKKEFSVLQSVCFAAAIKGKKKDVLNLFEQVYVAGLSLASSFDNILRPTVEKLEILTAKNIISHSEYHLALNVLSSAMIQLNDIISNLPKNNKTIICASIESEKNDIELKALTTLLEINGFNVLNLGVGNSAEEVSQLVARTKPYAVCIYTVKTENMEKFSTNVKKIFESSRGNGSYFICAGNAGVKASQLLNGETESAMTFEEFGKLYNGMSKVSVNEIK